MTPSKRDVKTEPAERPLPRDARRKIGRYTLKGVLGRGGMAVVYRAEDQQGAPVALKVMDVASLDETARTRFEREAGVLGELKHPGIIRVIEQGIDSETKGRPLLFFAMELIHGHTLHELLLQRQRLWLSQAVRVTHDACQALAVVHARGIIHRDIKPSNVFVTSDGRVVVADFGVCLVPDATPVTSADRCGGRWRSWRQSS